MIATVTGALLKTRTRRQFVQQSGLERGQEDGNDINY